MSATLTSLRIRNLALVEDLEWTPGAGFNAITGETGAGKSILIGALKLLLGERAEKSLIRAGAEQCLVEAIFELSEEAAISRRLDAAGLEPCEGGQLLLKRSLTASGSRQFVNGSVCMLNVLRQLGDDLVDLHGPHDHQSLFSREQQTALLDAFAGAAEELKAYLGARAQWAKLRQEKEGDGGGGPAIEREMALLEHQIEEIETAALDEAEEEALVARHRAAANSQRLAELCAGLVSLLNENEAAVFSQLADGLRQSREVARLDPRMETLPEQFAVLSESVADLSREIEHYSSGLETDPAALMEMQERLDLLGKLKRKYGATLAEVVAHAEDCRGKLAGMRERESRRATLDADIQSARDAAEKAAQLLSAKRGKGVKKLAGAVTAHLRDLGFRQAYFTIQLEAQDHLPAAGAELAEFVFAPNPGEPPQPLRQIASSGEISRVMLALKSALAGQEQTPLMVFDEIDANVGGEIATKVAAKMGELGARHQVLCITHLPQVAAAAQRQFVVEKEVAGGRSFTALREVAGAAREEELARMLGGKQQSALDHARTLLGAHA
ncbi:MAG TPA: DNA repair protein RecN [Chthoniobacterales bacterium]